MLGRDARIALGARRRELVAHEELFDRRDGGLEIPVGATLVGGVEIDEAAEVLDEVGALASGGGAGRDVQRVGRRQCRHLASRNLLSLGSVARRQSGGHAGGGDQKAPTVETAAGFQDLVKQRPLACYARELGHESAPSIAGN